MHRLALVLAILLLAPTVASAAKVEETFFNSTIPNRIDHLIGFAPTTFAIHPRGERIVPFTVRVGGRTYRYIFGNAAANGGPSVDIFIRNMISQRRFPSPQGIFLDRRLTVSERRHMKVRADLGRDADVLVVARGHPACASGVSRAAARGITAGKIRTWSAAGVPKPESGDAITLRRAGNAYGEFAEPRFGASGRVPRGAKTAPDGGLSAAASGDLAIAAVTSWSRARAYQATTCAVRVGGAAPTDASVRAVSHPDAYAITYATLRRLSTPRDRAVPRITAAFLQYLTGPRGSSEFRKRGMLLVKDQWRAVPGPRTDPPPAEPDPPQPPPQPEPQPEPAPAVG